MSYAKYPSLAGKVIVITGGTSGIGADFVKQFSAQGSKVAFIGRHKKNGEALVQTVAQETGQTPLYICADLAEVASLKTAIATIEKKLGSIHVLINNAADDRRHSSLSVDEALWDSLMAINLRHPFFAAQAVIPGMQKNGGGSIINLSSNCFLLSDIPQYPLYATAKSAILGMTRALAREFGKDRIRVNCILPGWVMTKKQLTQWVTEESLAEALHQQSLKQKLYPEDVSRLALFLAADDSHMITKQTFIIDGGRV